MNLPDGNGNEGTYFKLLILLGDMETDLVMGMNFVILIRIFTADTAYISSILT